MQQNASSNGLGEALPGAAVNNLFPAWQRRKQATIDPSVDLARREFWRAYHCGSLTEDELGSILDRLDFGAIH